LQAILAETRAGVKNPLWRVNSGRQADASLGRTGEAHDRGKRDAHEPEPDGHAVFGPLDPVQVRVVPPEDLSAGPARAAPVPFDRRHRGAAGAGADALVLAQQHLVDARDDVLVGHDVAIAVDDEGTALDAPDLFTIHILHFDDAEQIAYPFIGIGKQHEWQ